jgi:hypothetical protein
MEASGAQRLEPVVAALHMAAHAAHSRLQGAAGTDTAPTLHLRTVNAAADTRYTLNRCAQKRWLLGATLEADNRSMSV